MTQMEIPMPVQIEDPHGNIVTDMTSWANIFDSPRERRHWKPGRSAHSLADYVIQHRGLNRINERVGQLIGQSVTFSRAIVEHEVRFDEFGKGRMHDLGVYGNAADGQSVFVGVEAKVDESFNKTIGEAYFDAKCKELSGKSTKAPQRIEQLMILHFGEIDRSMFDLRYQLLYATAGTLAADADLSILLVVVFRTELYDELKGADNHRDYIAFMEKLSATRRCTFNQHGDVHEVEIGGKPLTCSYEHISLGA